MGKTSLNNPIEKCLYKAMIGTGGIGAGSLFLLSGNHTLGREESRVESILMQGTIASCTLSLIMLRYFSDLIFPFFPLARLEMMMLVAPYTVKWNKPG